VWGSVNLDRDTKIYIMYISPPKDMVTHEPTSTQFSTSSVQIQDRTIKVGNKKISKQEFKRSPGSRAVVIFGGNP
jgi:hypothetical protein